MTLLRIIFGLATLTNLFAQDSATFSTKVNVVTLYASVRDPALRFVLNLDRDDFVLEEDGKPQAIRYFSREFDLPLTIGLVVDTCLWQRSVIGEEKTASLTFLDRVLRDDFDKAFVLRFDRTVEITQEFTSSHQKLGQALAALTTGSQGGCRFVDGVRAASELMKHQSGRKALILLSAAIERGSRQSGETAIEYAQRSDAIIYSIPFQGAPWPRVFVTSNALGGIYKTKGRRALEQLARDSGGRYFPRSRNRPLQEIYRNIEEELRSQYSIGFTPTQTNDNRSYRKLRLRTKNGNLVVQSRAGYYPEQF